jgi:hypothetical protein
MKKLLFLTYFFVNIFCLYSQNEFNNYPWGSTIDYIIKNEGLPDNEEYEYEKFFLDLYNIIYENKIVAEYPSNIRYDFIDNKLHLIYYYFLGNYSIKNWVEIYFYLRDELINIYGEYEYSHDEFIGETDDHKINRLMQSLSEDLGRKNDFFTERIIYHNILWFYNDTIIEMELTYIYDLDNFQIDIYFISPDYNKIWNELWYIRSNH